MFFTWLSLINENEQLQIFFEVKSKDAVANLNNQYAIMKLWVF